MMKKRILFFAGCFLGLVSIAQRAEIGLTYIETYKEIAMQEMLRSGVPAAITLAQGILESQYGNSELAKKSNNHFGIKCKENWDGERVYHDDDERGECFRKYNNVAESFKDHSDFLRNRPYYTNLFQLNPADYESWAKGLKDAGYATEVNYPQMLIKLIKDYNLNDYTLLTLKAKAQKLSIKQVLQTQENSTAVISQPEKVQEVIVINQTDSLIDLDKDDNPTTKSSTRTPVTKTAQVEQKQDYPDGIFTINHTKVIYAKAGTSLLSLAENYQISYNSLLDFNDLNELDILQQDQLIYLEKKMKKGAKDFYVANGNETMYDIAQKEGLRVESLEAYNKIQKHSKPLKGEKIYLRSIAPVTPKIALVQTDYSKSTSFHIHE